MKIIVSFLFGAFLYMVGAAFAQIPVQAGCRDEISLNGHWLERGE